ncbi:MAG: FAD-dependent oxidoreductase [Polyangiaceae bacterium]
MVNFYVNPDKLQAHLLRISPEDREPIVEFCDGCRRLQRLDFEQIFMAPTKLTPWLERLKFALSLFGHFKFLGNASETNINEFVSRFKSPLLREAFKYVFFVETSLPLVPHYTTLSTAWKGNAGFPEGGSLGIAMSVARRYEQLGGEIIYSKRIKKILVERNRAIGVQFDDGSCDFADIVISACDGRTVVYDMLDGKYVDKSIDTLYNEYAKEPHIISGIVAVFLGVDRTFPMMPHSVTHLLTDAELSGLPAPAVNSICIQNRTKYDHGFAQPGKSVVYAWYSTSYDFWSRAYENQDTYKAEKARASEFVIQRLERTYPEIRSQIEVTDVSTPMTMVRYTGNHRGSIACWKPFSGAEHIAEKFGNSGMKLPGLDNFYMSGQWTLVGGLIRAVSSGRFAIQFACRDDGKKFRTQEN